MTTEVYLRGVTWHYRFQIKAKPFNGSCGTSDKRAAQRLANKVFQEAWEQIKEQGLEPIKLHKLIDEFVASKSHLQSHATVRNRLSYFKAIPDKHFHLVTPKESIEVKEKMLADGAEKSSVKLSVQYWNSLIKYAEEKGYSGPKKIKNIGGVKSKLRYFSIEEEQKMLEQLSVDADYRGKGNADVDKQRQDNFDLFCLMIDTGARINEIQLMDWNQVDLVARKLLILRSKGGLDTNLDMSDRVYEILSRRHKVKTGHLVLNAPSSQSWFRVAVRDAKLSSRPSIPTPHSCRHTFASRLIKAKVGLKRVQKLLGHISIKSTMIYAHLEEDDDGAVVDAINKAAAQREVKPATQPLLRVV